jgi:serine phosphatase RsbU (regulator of sigma subunit)
LTKTDFKKSLKIENIPLKTGDKVLIYTDGIIEAARPDEKQQMLIWGEENFLKQIELSRSLNASRMVKTITKELKTFYSGYPLIDDCTLLIIEKNA